MGSSDLLGSQSSGGSKTRADDRVRFVPHYGNRQGDTDSVGFTKEGPCQQKEGWIRVCQENKIV